MESIAVVLGVLAAVQQGRTLRLSQDARAREMEDHFVDWQAAADRGDWVLTHLGRDPAFDVSVGIWYEGGLFYDNYGEVWPDEVLDLEVGREEVDVLEWRVSWRTRLGTPWIQEGETETAMEGLALDLTPRLSHGGSIGESRLSPASPFTQPTWEHAYAYG